MFGLGVTELLVVGAIVVLIFGARRLPELGSGLARAIKGFKAEIAKEDPKPASERPQLSNAAGPARADEPD